MRRIIERKVTVVTTTTWTISWQDAPPHPSSEVDPVHPAESNTDVLLAAQAASSTIDPKESGTAEKKKLNHRSKSSNPIKLKPERK